MTNIPVEAEELGWMKVKHEIFKKDYWIYNDLTDAEGRHPIMFDLPICEGNEFEPQGWSDRPKTLISFGENIDYRRKVIQDLVKLCDSKYYNCGNIGLVVHVVDAKTGDYYIGNRLIDKTVSKPTRQEILQNVLKSF